MNLCLNRYEVDENLLFIAPLAKKMTESEPIYAEILFPGVTFDACWDITNVEKYFQLGNQSLSQAFKQWQRNILETV